MVSVTRLNSSQEIRTNCSIALAARLIASPPALAAPNRRHGFRFPQSLVQKSQEEKPSEQRAALNGQAGKRRTVSLPDLPDIGAAYATIRNFRRSLGAAASRFAKLVALSKNARARSANIALNVASSAGVSMSRSTS